MLPATSPQGPTSPSLQYAQFLPSVTSVISGSSIAWLDPINAATSGDGNYATVTLNQSTYPSDLLRSYDFGLNIPSSKTINGIRVNVIGFADNANYMTPYYVILRKNFTTAATKTWDTVTYFSNSISTLSYGGGSDLWGTTWTPTDLNSSGFGVDIQVRNETGFMNQTAYIDNIQVVVWFS